MNDEEFEVVRMMTEMGGSFVQALANCFHRADPTNFNKLKNAFPEYWEQYSEYAKANKRVEQSRRRKPRASDLWG